MPEQVGEELVESSGENGAGRLQVRDRPGQRAESRPADRHPGEDLRETPLGPVVLQPAAGDSFFQAGCEPVGQVLPVP